MLNKQLKNGQKDTILLSGFRIWKININGPATRLIFEIKLISKNSGWHQVLLISFDKNPTMKVFGTDDFVSHT